MFSGTFQKMQWRTLSMQYCPAYVHFESRLAATLYRRDVFFIRYRINWFRDHKLLTKLRLSTIKYHIMEDVLFIPGLTINISRCQKKEMYFDVILKSLTYITCNSVITNFLKFQSLDWGAKFDNQDEGYILCGIARNP